MQGQGSLMLPLQGYGGLFPDGALLLFALLDNAGDLVDHLGHQVDHLVGSVAAGRQLEELYPRPPP